MSPIPFWPLHLHSLHNMEQWYRHILFILLISGTEAADFTLENNCNDTIWPRIQSGAGIAQVMNGGLQLSPGESININMPQGWSGRVWGRRGCSFDKSGKGRCITGDFRESLQCAGAGGEPPATLAELTLNSRLDFYDISLVDGYNMPVSIMPYRGGGGSSSNCSSVTCAADLNLNCPSSLQVKMGGAVVACRSACLAFQSPEYCCSGAYGNPNVCKASDYSQYFKAACPMAYSYGFDDHSSLFTCQGTNYLISFC